MASYNWWRRRPKRKTLKKSAPLIDKIEHGDFEVSQYLREANFELKLMEREKRKIRKKGEEESWGKQTIEHDIRKKTEQYRRRYNRLTKDFLRDDAKILQKLKKELNSKFDDYWEYLYNEWLDGNLEDLTVKELYKTYELINKNDFEL